MMKLAEALMERSDLKTRIEQLAARLNENAKVQEGDEPADAVSREVEAQIERDLRDHIAHGGFRARK